MLLGLIGAFAAAVAYGSATVLQAVGVRRLSLLSPDAGFGDRIAAGRLYGAGLALDGVGFLASVLALRTLPLFLVESAVASSVGVTAVLSVMFLHARLRRGEVMSLAVLTVGLSMLAVSAHPGPARALGTSGGWLLLGCALALGILVVLGVRSGSSRSAVVLATASGLGFGLVGIAARVLAVRHPWWHTTADPVLWALAAAGVLAAVAYGFGLDRAPATTVAAITFAVETIVPAAIGLAALGDSVRARLVPVAALGFIASLGACIAIASRAEARVD